MCFPAWERPIFTPSKIIVVYVSVISFLKCKWKDYFPELLRWRCWPINVSARAHAHTNTSSSVPKARSNPPYQTHKCDKGPSVQTTGPDHDKRTAQLHQYGNKCREVKWSTQAADSHASNSRQYKMPYTHIINPPDIHACNTPKGSLYLSKSTLHLHYKQLMVNAKKS